VSAARWEYQDAGSGFGHMQRVGDAGEYAAYTTSQKAYRAYQDHGLDCVVCAETQCARADELWQAYTQAQSGDDE